MLRLDIEDWDSRDLIAELIKRGSEADYLERALAAASVPPELADPVLAWLYGPIVGEKELANWRASLAPGA